MDAGVINMELKDVQSITCYTVQKEHTAKVLGSGGLEVLATPQLIAWMEETAYKSVDLYVGEGNTTVGISINMSHLKASKVGAFITIKATLDKIEDRKLTFYIEATEDDQLIGKAIHERFIVNKEHFINKTYNK